MKMIYIYIYIHTIIRHVEIIPNDYHISLAPHTLSTQKQQFKLVHFFI